MSRSDKHEARARELGDELKDAAKVADIPQRYDVARLRKAKDAAARAVAVASSLAHELDALIMATRNE